MEFKERKSLKDTFQFLTAFFDKSYLILILVLRPNVEEKEATGLVQQGANLRVRKKIQATEVSLSA